MARSIVLRFDTHCVDCGASLPAGTTARWFGRGRVSCCGSPRMADLPPSDKARAQRVADAVLSDPGEFRRRIAASDPSIAPGSAPVAPGSPALEAHLDAKLPEGIRSALFCGCSPSDVAWLAKERPNLRLLVRLSSGARFIVPAMHAEHVVRCVVESCVDRVRDVTKAADGTA